MHLKAIKDTLVAMALNRAPKDPAIECPVFLHHSGPIQDGVPTILLMDPFGGTPVNKELPGYYKTGAQIVVSSTRFEAGQELANRIFKELRLYEEDKGDVVIKELSPKHLPISYRKNEGKTYEFSINYFYVFVTK